MHHTRTVEKCAEWVRNVEPNARWFFFRRQSNWHCSPCPTSYRGHPTSGTAVDRNTRISIYQFSPWRTAGWLRTYTRVHEYKYCRYYKKTSTSQRTIDACGRWVRSVDKEAKFFMFRLNSNFHCSPCPMYYKGDGQHLVNDRSYMSIYRYNRFSAPHYNWRRHYQRVHVHRYCSGDKKTSHGYRNVE
jgi:hypothetical protein